MPRSPGVRLDIMQDHAGTVIGGVIDRSPPHVPASARRNRFGSSSSQLSNTSDGSAQSNPMIITLLTCIPPARSFQVAKISEAPGDLVGRSLGVFSFRAAA